MIYNALTRSAASILNRSGLPRQEAKQISDAIAAALLEHFDEAALRYNTVDEFEIGEQAALEWLSVNRKACKDCGAVDEPLGQSGHCYWCDNQIVH